MALLHSLQMVRVLIIVSAAVEAKARAEEVAGGSGGKLNAERARDTISYRNRGTVLRLSDRASRSIRTGRPWDRGAKFEIARLPVLSMGSFTVGYVPY